MFDIIAEVPRIYTGFSEWLFTLIYVILITKRFSKTKTIIIILAFLILLPGYQLAIDQLPPILFYPGMFFAIILMGLFIYSTTKVDFLVAIYFSLISFMLSEFNAAIEWQIFFFFYTYLNMESIAFQIFSLIIIYGAIFSIVFSIERVNLKNKHFDFINKSELFNLLLVFLIIYPIANLSFIEINSPFTTPYPSEFLYIRTLILFMGSILIFLQREHRLATFVKLELVMTRNILNKQYEKFQLTQDMKDIVNHRYHDLKYHIEMMKANIDTDTKNKYISDLEKTIRNYENAFNTGSEILDTILMARVKLIEDNDINFTYVTDGNLLSFISTIDLVSIFSNALDNAIENVSLTKNVENRIIKFSIYQQQQLLMIRLENYSDVDLKFSNEKILTTKKDKLNHGYGLQSIREVVGKYDGTVNIQKNSKWFKLYILIPIP